MNKHKNILYSLIVYLLFMPLAFAQQTKPTTKANTQSAAKTETKAKFKSELIVEDGKVESLGEGADKFLAIYKPALQLDFGGIVLLPDAGGTANSDDVIRPLRRVLAENGWSTLAIELKQGDKTDSINFKRINVAVGYLSKQKADNIFIIAYGTSSYLALDFIQQTSGRINGAILISAYHMAKKTEDYKKLIDKDFPILDILGSVDYLNVVSQAKQRQQAFSQDKEYEQYTIWGADHYYSGLYGSLTDRIRGWMRKHRKAEKEK